MCGTTRAWMWIVVVSMGCAGTKGEDGVSPLVALTPEAAGAHCPTGGTRIETGPDANHNGVLDPAEIKQADYVCGGTTSRALVTSTPVMGAPCTVSGLIIRSGLDANGNGALDADEVASTAHLCDGLAGDAGVGVAMLSTTVPEPSGTNCTAGGLMLQLGLDLNSDGELAPTEVTSTRYLCNGQSGSTGLSGPMGTVSVVRVDVEPAGTNCRAGGRMVRSGVDSDGDGQLGAAEVQQTAYVCDGAAGEQSLVSQVPEPVGVNCAFGGVLLRTGLDLDRDGLLDANEVTATNYLCDPPHYFDTGWTASFLKQLDSGEVAPGTWQSARRKATLFKQRNETYLKITVTDNVRFGHGATGATSGTYSVLVNGAWLNCATGVSSRNGSNTANEIYYPLAMVCVLPGLRAGLYEFETFVVGNMGTAYVGWNSLDAQTVVEELNDGRFAYTATSDETLVASPTPAQAAMRTVTYVKQGAATLLKVTLSDSLRATNGLGGEGHVRVRMDGVDTSCSLMTSDAQGGDLNEYSAPFVMTCVLAGVPVGPHVFTVWLSALGGQASLGGTTEHSMLLIEERDPANFTFINAPSSSGDLTNTSYAQVPGRALTVNVATAGHYKLTYSDTFRSALGCNGQAGFYAVYFDGASAELSNGMRFGGSNTFQDHHRGINHTSIWSLQPGAHAFTIRGRTDCGANAFGAQRGQVLMLLEPMP